ncbi:MAG: hypothetical protein RLZZ136_902 [Pseudomonadota bacterium]|jgi:cytochrome P450
MRSANAEAIVNPKLFADFKQLNLLLRDLRQEDRLHWVEPEGFEPFWLAVHHQDIVAIEKASTRFLSAPRQPLFSLAHQARSRKDGGGSDASHFIRNVTAMDGEEHRAYREISQAYFTPKGMEAVAGSIEDLAKEFIDKMADAGGECDFARIAMNYPLRVIMSLLGIPQTDEPMMLAMTQQTLSGDDPDFNKKGQSGLAAVLNVRDYFMHYIEQLRSHPQNNLASVIANARINGELLPERDVFGYFFITATAGHDTTSYALSGGLLALLENPAEMAKLRANPALIHTAVEEILRWTTPVKHFCRTASEDCEVAGKLIKKDDIILLCYPSANRDEDSFDAPFEFRVDRRPNRQLAFGTGPHVCLGQYLARLELTCFFNELIKRVDDIEMTSAARFVEGHFVGGVKELAIRYKMIAN